MQNKLFRKCLTSIIVILFFGISIVSSVGIITDKSIDESLKLIISLNGQGSIDFFCDGNSLYRSVPHGSGFLGYAPGINGLAGGTWIPEDEYPWWVAEFSDGTNGSAIWKINTEGDYVQVVPDCGVDLSGLEYNPATGQLYGCYIDKLYIIDMVTGIASLVGEMPGYFFIGIGINNDGHCYSVDIITDNLYRINLSDASTEFIGSTGQSMNYFWDCSFDHDADPEEFYIVAYTSNQNLFLCNIETGYFTLLGPFPGGSDITTYTIAYEIENQIPYADFIYTPLNPYINETVLFDASQSFDLDGDILLYAWDWDNDEDYEEYSTSPLISHSFSNAGGYFITLRVWDDFMGYSTKTQSLTIFGNNPPEKPVISGPTKGKTAEKYTYCISSVVDPDGDNLYVYWDWGDGKNSGWLGPYVSGQEICESHSWKTKDTYIIKVKLKDVYGAESEWGTFEVTIPRTRASMSSLFLNLAVRFPILEKLLHSINIC